MEKIIFYVFSTLTVISALGVVVAKNPVRAVLCLVLTFFTTAALWLLLEAEFLAITLVLVYVGAVMVLFLFVVMMLDIEKALVQQTFVRYLPIGLVASGLLFGLLFLGLKSADLTHATASLPVPKGEDYSNVKVLGTQLYTEFLLPFEIAGVLLLVAIIAAIALTLRGRRQKHSMAPGDQVLVKKADRLKIVKMSSEIPPGGVS